VTPSPDLGIFAEGQVCYLTNETASSHFFLFLILSSLYFAEEIRQQQWFAKYDFEGMMNRTVRAPWTPSVSSITDTSNFDPLPEEEPHSYGNKYVDNSGWDKDF
jgi:hypothetical protein